MRHSDGVNTRSDLTSCMVVGCGKKAIYKNAQSARMGGAGRGFCATHKHLAVEAAHSLSYHTEWLARQAEGK